MEKMIQYTGHKTIKACPMTLGDAEQLLNRSIDTSAVEGREQTAGYLVEYDDGYRSWLPKETFEKAYRVSETHIDRMYIEKEQLKRRYLHGREYSFTQQFRRLPKDERMLLTTQLDTMEKYLYVLSRRIELAERTAALQIQERDKQEILLRQSEWLKELVGMTVVDAGSCDECQGETEGCKKLLLKGGGCICVKDEMSGRYGCAEDITE